MKRRVGRWLVALSLMVVIGLPVVYRIVASSLPQIDGVIAVADLTADATIARDGRGIPTIRAMNRMDLAHATGFAHGQDRFFQMDLTRRKAAGELAELIGGVAVSLDRQNRLHRFRARADAVLARMTPGEQTLLRSYTDGVNAGLGSLASKPFEYHLLRAEPLPWRMQDSMLVAYAMFMVLNDERASADVRRGIVHGVLPAEVYEWLYPEGTQWDAPLQGRARAAQPVPPATVFDISSRYVGVDPASHTQYPEGGFPGSNNWAVSGDHTSSGRAMVANDMHLDIAVPNVFYRARLIVEDQSDTSGVTLPGTPVVVAGSNGKVAWGFTNSYGDWSDAVIVRPGPDENSYRTPNGVRQFETYREIIDVKGEDAQTLVVRETIWGPVLDDDSLPGPDIAVSWIAHHPAAINMQQIGLETAADIDEAMSIANGMGIPPQNFVCGDAGGNIGWTIAGRIPRRADFDARLPADWSRTNGWDGWLAADKYPRIRNPQSGRIWTANARVVDRGDLEIVGFGGYDLGARARQIRDRLFAKDLFVAADMLAIQNDDRALFLQRWRDMLLDLLDEAAVSRHPARREYRKLLDDWIPRAVDESVGYRLVRAFRLELRATVFEMLVSPVRELHGPDMRLRISNQFEAPLWQLVTERPRHLLSADYASWRALLLAVVDRQLAYFAENSGDALANRTWGERNTAAVRHPLSRALPVLSRWLDMPTEPLSGDANMPKALGPAFGASERFGVSPGDEANGYLHMPAGQSGHPMSAFYRAGHDDWAKVRQSPFLPGEPAYVLRLVASD